ncbi:MAG: glycogen synthase [Planctomycetota bacterium]|nr:glycogen synthase [Planctomycetota bacterium]
MKVAIAASELAPFAKTGGLGDVTAALSRYLHKAGHDVRPFLPLYGNLRIEGHTLAPVEFLQDVPVPMGPHTFHISVFTTPLPNSDCPVYFIACPPLYGRKETYSQAGDEHLRFGLLSLAAIVCCQRMGFGPDVFHVHDWHTALLPLYLGGTFGWDRLFANTKTVLTLHNLAYQGMFPASVVDELGLGGFRERLHQDHLMQGYMGFLETGVIYADAITAVSETFAREIQTPEHGFGLDGMLRARSESVYGIVNGVDYEEWSPEVDELIPHRYAADDLTGKAENKAALRRDLGLEARDGVPIVGLVSRLTPQKGLDLAFDVLPRLLRSGRIQLAALGSGADRYVRFLDGLQRAFRGQAVFWHGYNNELAHRIEAGADMFLMPSLFEPCGLNQMYSLKYGTPPIVRKTGGLADTVQLFDPDTGEGTGFVFEHYTRAGLSWALHYALDVWDRPDAWQRLVQNGMAQDFSWERQIQKYVALYRSLATG